MTTTISSPPPPQDLPGIVAQVSKIFLTLGRGRSGRATHTSGVLAQGTFRPTAPPTLPSTDLWSGGKVRGVLLRHATIQGEPDDAALDGLGAALKVFEDGVPDLGTQPTPDGALDLLLNTGAAFFARNARAFLAFLLTPAAQRGALIASDPDLVADAISEAFRRASSYTTAYYHSQITHELRDAVGGDHWVRFRLLHEDRAAERGHLAVVLRPAPGVTWAPRPGADARSATCLRDDFGALVLNGGVRYALQAQVRPMVPAERAAALDCTRPWDAGLWPWVTVGEIHLTSIVGPLSPTSRGMAFDPGRGAWGIRLPDTTDPMDPASIGVLRREVYRAAAAARNTPATYEYWAPPPTPAGKPLARFDPASPLPSAERPTLEWALRSALVRLLQPSDEAPGVVGIPLHPQLLPTFMPTPLVRVLDPTNTDDEVFVERRLNGYHPGQLRPVGGVAWDHEIRLDVSAYKVRPGALLPTRATARFVTTKKLNVHSIELVDAAGTARVVFPNQGAAWTDAKRAFRSVEFLVQELQLHLARCHINLEQYALALFRNVRPGNPVRDLLDQHLAGLIHINWRGDKTIVGPRGFITQWSFLQPDQILVVIRDEVARLHYSWDPRTQLAGWDPSTRTLAPTPGDRYGPAVVAMWKLLGTYVDDVLERNRDRFKPGSKWWDEVVAMSQELDDHAVVPPTTPLRVSTFDEVKALCRYVIYHAVFLHSWANFRQYDDAGDPEWVSIGSSSHPAATVMQVALTYLLSGVRHRPVLTHGPARLRELVLAHRADIEPGIPLTDLMMTIDI